MVVIKTFLALSWKTHEDTLQSLRLPYDLRASQVIKNMTQSSSWNTMFILFVLEFFTFVVLVQWWLHHFSNECTLIFINLYNYFPFFEKKLGIPYNACGCIICNLFGALLSLQKKVDIITLFVAKIIESIVILYII